MEHSLRRILPSDKRQNINRKFDDSVAEFFAMAYHFDCEIEAVPENDEKTMQSLGLKFLEDMNLIIENAKLYEDEIKWSMLDIRLDINTEYKERMDNDIKEFRFRINDIINKGGVYIFSQIKQKVLFLDKMFEELVTLNVSRTDDDYEEIFKRTQGKYDSTLEFIEFKKYFIEKICKIRFGNKLATTEQIDELIREWKMKALCNLETGMIWCSSNDNPSMVARLLCQRQLSDDSIIRRYFIYFEEIEMLMEWRQEAMRYTIKTGRNNIKSDRLEIMAPYSVEKLRQAWGGIHEVMSDACAKGWEWCALYHALSISHKINNVDFWTFKKWIQQEFGEEIITWENYKKYKKNYFFVTNQEEWTLDKYKLYYKSMEDPKQRGVVFGKRQMDIYDRITEQVYAPLVGVFNN